MKKRSMMLGTSIMLAVLLIAGGTFAWFTATTEAVTNEFVAGTLAIKLHEDFDAEDALNVNPGDCYTKRIYVENTGSKRAYIRIAIDQFNFQPNPNYSNNPNLPTDVVKWNLNHNWEKQGEYFVYKWIVEPGDSTASLLVNDKICFEKCMDNRYQGSRLTLKLHADGMQTTNGATWADWSIDGGCTTTCPQGVEEEGADI